MRLTVILGGAMLPGLLGGCAAMARDPSPPPRVSPDCSFRAATSCWTPTARFPSRPAAPADTAPGKILNPPTMVLAVKRIPRTGRNSWPLVDARRSADPPR
jgi:hypothetical protein